MKLIASRLYSLAKGSLNNMSLTLIKVYIKTQLNIRSVIFGHPYSIYKCFSGVQNITNAI